jgi:uncharacterized protein
MRVAGRRGGDMQFDIEDVPDRGRYEARDDGRVAGFAEYQLSGPVIVFTHTEVDDAYEGQGVGGALVRTSLDEARAAGRKVLPLCPFYRGWLERHPEYADLVHTGSPG